MMDILACNSFVWVEFLHAYDLFVVLRSLGVASSISLRESKLHP